MLVQRCPSSLRIAHAAFLPDVYSAPAVTSAGNINQLILKVDSYAHSLEETQGIIAEFVNPKYTDASKTAFKSSTRLECMMQDYPKALPSSAAVGFTLVNQVPSYFLYCAGNTCWLSLVHRLSLRHCYNRQST